MNIAAYLEAYLQVHPRSTATDALSNLLLEKSLEVIDAPKDPILTEVIDRIDEFPSDNPENESGRQWAKQLTGFIGSDGMASCLMYWQVRDVVREFQRSYNISGLVKITRRIADKQITYFQWDEQLHLLDSDIPLLKADVPFVVDFFLDAIGDNYNLLSSPEDDVYEPTDDARIRALSALTISADIWTESNHWVQTDHDSWRGFSEERFQPDKVRLKLSTGRPDGDECGNYFVAEHKDESRFPWRAE